MKDFDEFADKLLQLRPIAVSQIAEQLGLEHDDQSVTFPNDQLANFLATYVEQYTIAALRMYDDWSHDRED